MRSRLAAGTIAILLGLLPLPTALDGLAGWGVAAAASSSSVAVTSHILLNLPSPTSAGQNIHIQATLVQGDGLPVAAAWLNLFITGRFAAKALTDSNGTADFLLLGKFRPGRYYATVSYFGDIPGPSTATGTFDVTPDTLVISVPKFIPAGQKVVITATLLRDGQPIPGIKVHFTANGVKKHATKTDAHGVARWVFVDDFPAGSYNLKIEARVYRGRGGWPRLISATEDASFTVAPDGISLVLPDSIAIGARIPVTAVLASQGQPIPGATLHLLINGKDVRQARTDAYGIAHFILKGNLAEGRYPITVTYPTHHRRGRPAIGTFANAPGVLQIRPLALAIQTVPKVPNVAFVLDGKTVFVSDSEGVARIAVRIPGGHTLAIRIANPNEQTQMQFSRWGDDHFATTRPLDIRQDTTFYAGLRLAYLSQIRFVDRQGNLLDNRRISKVVITGPDAEIIRLKPPYLPIWLWTPAPVKRTGEPGLYVTPAPYAVASADFDGLSVADRGKQQFAVCLLVGCVGNKTWSIPLQLFRLDIHAEDALLHFSLPRSVVVTSPIGKKVTVKLDRHGDAHLNDLARGLYSVHVLASGISAAVPVALSKSQPVDIPVISILDLLIGLGLNLFAVSGLFMLGRRRAWLVRIWTLRRPAWGGVRV